MDNWYNTTRAKTENIFQAIIKDNFVSEMMSGDLPKDIFGFYVNQDTLYLAEYKKALVAVGVKCYETNEIQFFLEAATGILAIEGALHQLFLEKEYVNEEPSPTCELYTSYMARVIDNASVEVGLAAILPCFTIYKEVGDYILENQSSDHSEANPYQSWIETYASEEFALAVEQAVAITNKYAQNTSAETLERMEEAFVKTSKLEWMFWNSAYRQEKWPV